MSAKKITVTLSIAEADALWSLADAGMGTPDWDGLSILLNMSSVRAGERALNKLRDARHA